MSIFPITNKLNLLCKERNCVVSHQECSLTSSGHSESVQWSSSSVSNLVCLPGSLCFANKSLKWTRSWLHRFASRVCIFFLLFKVQGNKDIQEAARIQIHVDREIWSYFINCFSVPSPTFRRRMLGEAPTATLFSFSSQILIGLCGGDFPSVAKEEAVI